jgi:hypothetical protein
MRCLGNSSNSAPQRSAPRAISSIRHRPNNALSPCGSFAGSARDQPAPGARWKMLSYSLPDVQVSALASHIRLLFATVRSFLSRRVPRRPRAGRVTLAVTLAGTRFVTLAPSGRSRSEGNKVDEVEGPPVSSGHGNNDWASRGQGEGAGTRVNRVTSVGSASRAAGRHSPSLRHRQPQAAMPGCMAERLLTSASQSARLRSVAHFFRGSSAGLT